MALLLILLACTQGWKVDKGDQALRAGELATAESYYREVLESDPDQVDALYGLGWLYHLSQDPDRAREYFKRCNRVAPQDWRCLRGLGSVARSEGHRALARAHFEEALELAPTEPRLLDSLGLVYADAGDHEAALTWFEKAVEADPGSGEYGFNKAEALLRLGRHEEALTAIDTALSQDIAEARFRAQLLVLRSRALVVSTSGREDPEDCETTVPPIVEWLDQADRALDQAEALQPDVPWLHSERQRVHRRRAGVTETCPGVAVRAPSD